MAKLIEFGNNKNELLRGIIDEADSNIAIIFLHGFERTTIEPKFKNIVDVLKDKYILFRFDFAGTGLSDGDFSTLTIDQMSDDLDFAIQTLKRLHPLVNRIYLVGHSIGAVVATAYTHENPKAIDKIIALAPAFNQKELQRYWFARSTMRKTDPAVVVTWENFTDYLDENKFYEFCQTRRMTGAHYLETNYCQEVEGKDYQILLDEDVSSKMMIVMSVLDDKVPFRSNNQLPADINIIELDKGDHDLESPDVVEKYLPKIIEFIG
jgi:pimeloyl-ACP methyl ester carboxylesterase